MFVVIVDYNKEMHYVDHKTKHDCVTVCGLNINVGRKNLLSIDNKTINCCKLCQHYHEKIYGPVEDSMARNINQQNLIINSLKEHAMPKLESRTNNNCNKFWRRLSRYKNLTKRKIPFHK